MTNVIRNQLGGTLVLYTVAMVGMMGMAALAIDLGFLRKARAEAQRGADAASLAGASAFIADFPRDVESTNAVALALQVGGQNYMNGVNFVPAELTVTVIVDSSKVRVKARRPDVPTWFARVFGILTLPVGAVAAAEASYMSGASCAKPLAIPDWWDDFDNDTDGDNLPSGTEQWLWDPGAGDVYHPAHYDSDGNGLPNDGAGTGLGSELRNTLPSPGERDWGRRVVLQPSVNGGSQACPTELMDGNKCYVPGWWGWWGGAPRVREQMILGCSGEAELGVTIALEPGFTNTLRQAIDDVMAMDPGAAWDPAATDSVTGKLGTVTGSSFGNKWRSSKRAWTVAMVAPADIPPDPSDHNTVFNNFMTFFLEGCWDADDAEWSDCSQGGPNKAVIGRFVGPAKGNLFGPNPGSMVRAPRLVE